HEEASGKRLPVNGAGAAGAVAGGPRGRARGRRGGGLGPRPAPRVAPLAAAAPGAVLVDIGIRPDAVRGVVLIARTAGLVAHLAEEMDHPLGRDLWLNAERHR